MAGRQLDAGRRDRLDRRLEAPHLAFGQGPILGRLQVGPQAGEADGRALHEPGGGARDVLDRESAAAEAGLDLELYPRGARRRVPRPAARGAPGRWP